MSALLLALAASGRSHASDHVEALAKLAVAESTWRAAGVRSYSFKFEYSAMYVFVGCDRGFASTVTNAVARVPTCRQLEAKFGSVPAMFTYIRQALVAQPDKVSVNFDAQLGYPRSFSVDPAADVTDDQFAFTVSSFRVSQVADEAR